MKCTQFLSGSVCVCFFSFLACPDYRHCSAVMIPPSQCSLGSVMVTGLAREDIAISQVEAGKCTRDTVPKLEIEEIQDQNITVLHQQVQNIYTQTYHKGLI